MCTKEVIMNTVEISSALQNSNSDRQQLEEQSQNVKVLVIKNSDGTDRWIWPYESNVPLFLNFYSPSTFKQHIFCMIIKIVFFLRLQRIIFNNHRLSGQSPSSLSWAIFTGTAGPNRKKLIAKSSGSIVKVADSALAKENLQNETSTLRYLANSNASYSFEFPEIISTTPDTLELKTIENKGTQKKLNDKHYRALQELREATETRSLVQNNQALKNSFAILTKLETQTNLRIPSQLVELLRQARERISSAKEVNTCLSHGDFTPWNTLTLKNGDLAILDWELSRTEMPIGFDFFHFHLQAGILIEKKSWAEIKQEIQGTLSDLHTKQIFGSEVNKHEDYLLYFLFIHITYYAKLYEDQQAWHEQIPWQIDVWIDSLRDLILSGKDRSELIRELFAEISGKDCATLKMEVNDPATLSEYSDIDLLVGSKQLAEKLVNFISHHPAILSYRISNKSYMKNIVVILKNREILSVDFIWKLKRKSTVYMDVKSAIENSILNSYDVKKVNPLDTRKYVECFYSLNNARIPAKYGSSEQATKQFNYNRQLDTNSARQNRGIYRVNNILTYYTDCVRSFFSRKGFTITFSGVDGAGKTTVINEVNTYLEKKLRRPVKLLRHRPSILPILSSFIYGKEKAEIRTMEVLPRTGTNSSFISSFVRFLYYYADYIIGQWYLYFFYILRGYVIIYDRYYFDFLIDSKRSNIILPSPIIKTFFRFILKPELNFFLFADPDTILTRKKELDRSSIVKLTHNYKSLFSSLHNKHPKKVFREIENIDLNETLASIQENIFQKELQK